MMRLLDSFTSIIFLLCRVMRAGNAFSVASNDAQMISTVLFGIYCQRSAAAILALHIKLTSF